MTTHTVPRKPRPFGRHLAVLVMVAIFGAAVVPSAHAQWQVNDANTQGKIDALKQYMSDNVGTTNSGDGKTLNGNLDAINKKMVIGTYKDTQPGKRVDDPDSKLPDDTDATASKLNDGAACSGLPAPQQTNCNTIVQLQNAQYKYMLTMYKNTKTRDDMLRELLKERQAINTDDPNQYGKLQDNTNKLTALYNLLALDQQQMQTVNYAYEANIAYLREKNAQLANSANTGNVPKPSGGAGGLGGGILGGIGLPGGGDLQLGSVLNGLISGVALKTALGASASSRPDGMKRLSVTDNGDNY